MSNELTVKQSFEQNMKDRIRESIGELIPDEELSKLIHRGIEESFFKENIVRDSYGREMRRDKSIIHSITKELLEPKIKEIVSEYVKEHNDEVMAQVKEVLLKGIGEAVLRGIASLFTSEFQEIEYRISDKIRNSIQ